MINITVRPIKINEFKKFLSVATESKHLDDIEKYSNQLLKTGCSKIKWCYVIESDEEFLGRFAFWTLPKLEKPLDIVLLDLSWSEENYLEVGSILFDNIKTIMKDLDITSLGHVVDLPAQFPQWQYHPERRNFLLENAGFKISRETKRFILTPPSLNEEISFKDEFIIKSLEDVSESEYIDALIRVSESTLDNRIDAEIKDKGAYIQAEEEFNNLKQMEYEKSWWKLIYCKDDNSLIGLVMPTMAPTFGTIAYIGVIPEKRGKGYIHKLLSLGTKVLFDNNVREIKVDTDINNKPMAAAFIKAGYTQFALRKEYLLKI